MSLIQAFLTAMEIMICAMAPFDSFIYSQGKLQFDFKQYLEV